MLQIQQRENQIWSAVIKQLLQIQHSRTVTSNRQQGLETLEQLEKDLAKLVEAGLGRRSDLSLVSSQILIDQQGLKSAQLEQQLAELSINDLRVIRYLPTLRLLGLVSKYLRLKVSCYRPIRKQI